MEENIIISNLNDFIFCPRSIYFHNLYSNYHRNIYHDSPQKIGENAHKKIDSNKYSSKKAILQGIDIYSEELGIIGKIDTYDKDKKILVERKNKIKTIYEGYYLQLYAQYFCLIEMGYEVKKIQFYSISDNKIYKINLPTKKDKIRLKTIISKMKSFNFDDNSFIPNFEKCKNCIYKELCDVNVE